MEHLNISFINNTCEIFSEHQKIPFNIITTGILGSFSYTNEPFIQSISSDSSGFGNTLLIQISKIIGKKYSPLNSTEKKHYLNLRLALNESFFNQTISEVFKFDTKTTSFSFETLKENKKQLEKLVVDTLNNRLSDIEITLTNIRLKDAFFKLWCTQFTYDLINESVDYFMPEISANYSFKIEDIQNIKKLEKELRGPTNKSIPTISEMSEIVGMSSTKFKKIFKCVLGYSPHQYVLEVRAKRAKELLELNQFTITEIAYKVGFNYPSGLTRLIKNKYRVSPQEIVKRRSIEKTK
ncbi:helix-turn-helix domain-containing protein [Emticicia sp. 17c]|uniref:helix-turn-helix domain-containing protein n=1 Tax=Emticicia sp. 17c TaxID=3127704 RepID=UPI00301BDD91